MTNRNNDDDYYVFWSSTPSKDLGFNNRSQPSEESNSTPNPSPRTSKRTDYESINTSDEVVDVPTNPVELAFEADLRALYAKYGVDPNQPEQFNKEVQQVRTALRRFKRDYHDSKNKEQNHIQLQLLKAGLNKLGRLANTKRSIQTHNGTFNLGRPLWYVLASVVIFIGAGIIYVSQDSQPTINQPRQEQAK